MSFGLYSPGLDIVTHGGFYARMKALDKNLVLVLNKRAYPGTPESRRYEIYDSAAAGGPKWQLVMRVPLTEDGRLRLPDNRELDALARSRWMSTNLSMDEMLDHLERQDDERDAQDAKERRNLAESMADDMKHFGRKITDTVESRNRSREFREKIRQEAT